MREILENVYGSKLSQYKKINASLPLYLIDNREFYSMELFGTNFVLVKLKKAERLNVASLGKQTKKYCDYFSADIVYGFPYVTTFQRKSLVENGISFISGNEQLFIPALGSYFSKCQKERWDKDIVKFSPTAQLLALLFVYGDKNSKYSKNEAARRIGVSAMSVTRAVRELKQIGVVEEEKIGNEVFISSSKANKVLYEEIKPYLVNPIQTEIYVEEKKADKSQMLQAGEYSLSKRSNLGYPKYEEYAIAKASILLKEESGYDPDLSGQRKLIKIQKWKYNPFILSNNGMVDPISLICSFQGDEDERIQMSLDEVESEIDKWLLTMN